MKRSIVITPQNLRSIVSDIGDGTFKVVDCVGELAGSQIRVRIPCDFENFYMEGMIKVVSSPSDIMIQPYGRGGARHSTSRPATCEGSAYKGRIRKTGTFRFTKELNHPAYTSDRDDSTKRQAFAPVLGRFAKIGYLCQNLENGHVLLQGFIDGVQVSEYVDRGDWSTTNSDFYGSCPRLQFNTTGYRQRNEILNKAGTYLTWRSDGAIWQFQYLLAQEL